MPDSPMDHSTDNERLAGRALDLIADHVATLRTLHPDELLRVVALLDDTEELLRDAVAWTRGEAGSVAGVSRDPAADRRRIWRALDSAIQRMAPGAEREAYERVAQHYQV